MRNIDTITRKGIGKEINYEKLYGEFNENLLNTFYGNPNLDIDEKIIRCCNYLDIEVDLPQDDLKKESEIEKRNLLPLLEIECLLQKNKKDSGKYILEKNKEPRSLL
ncbi:MAG: hypothetical protein Q7S33_00100 [Nanoarchaeota archaeon]|nr:hypothetical protein [Nanoarchaeota archaeon]